MTAYFVTGAAFEGLLGRREGCLVVTPTGAGGACWTEATGEAPSAPARARPSQSPKGFFFPPSESVGQYGREGAAPATVATQPRVLVGVRACELRARRYLDKVLMEGTFPDPSYARRREATTIISSDCADCAAPCFCTSVGGQPFAADEDDYDANLSPVDGGWVIDVKTDRGAAWLDGASRSDATPDQVSCRDARRREMTDRLVRQNADFNVAASDEAPPALPQEDDPAWREFSADCVECGACTNICPTCHCFYLYDHILPSGDSPDAAEKFERVRAWDSCLLSTYHRMAGGPGIKMTPRPRLSSRLANRVLHKFAYSPEQYGMLGCVGCGRCVDGCLGEIDVRQVVGALTGPRENGT